MPELRDRLLPGRRPQPARHRGLGGARRAQDRLLELQRGVPIRHVSAAALLVLAACGGPRAGRSEPIVLFRNAPYVHLTLGDKRGLFLFDVGANTSGVDADWLRDARHVRGGESAVAGTTGTLTASEATFDRLDLGHGGFARPRFLVQSFAHFDHPPEGRQAGLLGTDFIGAYCTTIDYRARTVTLELRGQRPPRSGGVPLTFPLNLPTAEVRVGGVAMPCRLDSGAAYIDDRPFLDVNAAAARALGGLRKTGEIHVAGVSGPETLDLLEGDLVLEIAGAQVEGVVLVLHSQGTLAVETPLALAGGNLLARLGRVTIDPFDGRLYVAPSQIE